MIAIAKQQVNKKDEPSEVFDMFANRSMTFRIAPEVNDNPMIDQGQSIRHYVCRYVSGGSAPKTIF